MVTLNKTGPIRENMILWEDIKFCIRKILTKM